MDEVIPEEIYQRLSAVYLPAGCILWWNSKNSNLMHYAPKELWNDGYRDEVLAELDDVTGGMNG